ncbi:MAG: GDP-mannose 4,6-dehydratase [Candidatus Micrarchaeota archaeon]|nr:GDP-mannose 4,6-dehydratase [Candidatus Micrarchaeota archaeon]
MQTVVTGGAGFIGSYICDSLLNEGNRVVCLDNFHTGNMANIEHNVKNSKFEVKKVNSGEIQSLGLSKVDVIFHGGIPSSSPMYKENPLLVGTVIAEFMSILEFARKQDSRLVFVSTSSLYNGLNPPHREDMLLKPTDLYSEARIAMERLANIYSNLYGMSIVGLRYFSVYGPREISKGKYANLVSQFLWDMKNNKSPVIYGDGSQSRDFTYVSDIVSANLLAANYSKAKFGVFNVGTGKSYSLNDVIKILNTQLKKDIKPTYIENKVKNYVAHTLADTSKTKRELGFEAKVKLDEGIRNIL